MTADTSRRSAGFTLIELMLSALILIVIMVYVTRAFTVQQQTYVVVDQVTEAQQGASQQKQGVDRPFAVRSSSIGLPCFSDDLSVQLVCE